MGSPTQSGGVPPQSKTLARLRVTLGIRGAFWSAPAERSGDGAFGLSPRFSCQPTPQSGVALRLPPQSKMLAQQLQFGLVLHSPNSSSRLRNGTGKGKPF